VISLYSIDEKEMIEAKERKRQERLRKQQQQQQQQKSSVNSASGGNKLGLSINVALPELCLSIVSGASKSGNNSFSYLSRRIVGASSSSSSQVTELALFSLDRASLSITLQHPIATAELIIQDFQIDNQMPSSTFPVVLARSPPLSGTASKETTEELVRGETSRRPLLHASIVRLTNKSSSAATLQVSGSIGALARGSTSFQGGGARGAGEGGGGSLDVTEKQKVVQFYPYASLLLQPMDINIEEVLIRKIVSFIPSELISFLQQQQQQSALTPGGEGGGGGGGGRFLGTDLSRNTNKNILVSGIANLGRDASNQIAGSILSVTKKNNAAKGGDALESGGGGLFGGLAESGALAMNRILGEKAAANLKTQMRELARQTKRGLTSSSHQLQRKGTKFMKKAAEKAVDAAGRLTSRVRGDSISSGDGGGSKGRGSSSNRKVKNKSQAIEEAAEKQPTEAD
jgi:hypothetical protein